MSDGAAEGYSGRDVLVTGGSGFLGRRLLGRLRESGARVVNLDLAPAGGSEAMFVKGDVRDPEATVRALGRLEGGDARSVLLFHLAGANSVPRSVAAPYGTFDLNVGGTAAVLEGARRSSRTVKTLVVSTAAVYDAAAIDGPVSESAALGPASPYAASKAAAEIIAFSYCRSLDLPVTVARLFNVYGPGQVSDAVIPTIVRQMLAGGGLRLGNVAAVRDFLHADDAVDALLALAPAKEAFGKAVNIGTGRGTSIAELVELLRGITGHDAPLAVDPDRLRERDANAVVADVTLLRELTGWAPSIDLADGLAAVVAEQKGGTPS